MRTGTGRVIELILEDGSRYARVSCPEFLIPGSGQYLLASHGSDSLLPVPLFHTESAPQGFIGPAPEAWKPGDVLALRGPLGRGFVLPASARRVGLVAFDCSVSRLRGLIQVALRQDASVVVLCDSETDHLPDEVEVLPVSGLVEILQWADFVALDVGRENLGELMERLGKPVPLQALSDPQILIRTPVPCGGLAECGVCAVPTRSDWKLACKDGPVFHLSEV